MWKCRKLWKSGWFRIPLGCLGGLTGGYLLASGQICGGASPLAAVLTGVCPPFYSLFVLAGALLAYVFRAAPDGMHYALAALVSVLSIRILFYEARRPHVLAVLSAAACVAAGGAVDYFFQIERGRFPLFVLEAMLIGAAVYFLSDAVTHLRRSGTIRLGAGRSFTFAMVYLLGVTALCGLNFSFCNVGRIAGISLTLLAARHYRQNGGTLCGALTACAVVLCSVPLGQPLLFLPVTAMLAGFLHRLPNAVYIPSFFLIQAMSAAVLDGSTELVRIVIELLLACTIYALCSKGEILRMIEIVPEHPEKDAGRIRREQFLSEAIGEVHGEVSAVLRHLRPQSVPEGLEAVHASLCTGCKNETYCWSQRRTHTEEAFRKMLHHPDANPIPEALDGCIRRKQMTAACIRAAQHAALARQGNTQLERSRSTMLACLHLLEETIAAGARRRDRALCEKETESLRRIAVKYGCEDAVCYVQRLKSGRYTAEVYTADAEQAVPLMTAALSELLDADMRSVSPWKTQHGMRCCFYEQPPYTMECSLQSLHAPGYHRCGDTARAFTDAAGNTWAVLSDGMGSGNSAALSSELAVRTFQRLVCSGMEADAAIRLINLMLAGSMPDEHFATLDLLRLDGDSGELTLYKSGAAPTLLYHGGHVRKIGGVSFPVGMLAAAEPFRSHMTAAPGDRLIMTSDGIHEAAHPFIRDLLLRGLDSETLVREICKGASVFRAGQSPDDITVITADVHYMGIFDEIPQESHKESSTVLSQTEAVC